MSQTRHTRRGEQREECTTREVEPEAQTDTVDTHAAAASALTWLGEWRGALLGAIDLLSIKYGKDGKKTPCAGFNKGAGGRYA